MAPGGNGDKKPRKGKSNFDPFVGSRSVEGLNPKNYDEYLSDKDVTMIMFYDAADPQCEWSKKHLLKAAKTTNRENHGYAAVDCIAEAELCAQEGITTLPTFKLFVRNKPVDTYTHPQAMTYLTIRNFVENMKYFPEPGIPACSPFKK